MLEHLRPHLLWRMHLGNVFSAYGLGRSFPKMAALFFRIEDLDTRAHNSTHLLMIYSGWDQFGTPVRITASAGASHQMLYSKLKQQKLLYPFAFVPEQTWFIAAQALMPWEHMSMREPAATWANPSVKSFPNDKIPTATRIWVPNKTYAFEDKVYGRNITKPCWIMRRLYCSTCRWSSSSTCCSSWRCRHGRNWSS